MKLSARQRKRRAYAQSQPRPPRAPRPPRPERKAPPLTAPPKAVRRNTMSPIFYFIFGGFGSLYALYYLVILVSATIGHHVDSKGKPVPPPGVGLYAVAVLFLALSIANILIGLKARRDRRAQ